MKITEGVVEKIVLSGLENLDPITLFIEDLGDNRGKLTVECYGEAWSAFWNSMGCSQVLVFLKGCNVDYIANKLFPPNLSIHVTDFDKISREINSEVDESTLLLETQQLEEVYGEDWYHSLPYKVCSEYKYLLRIVKEIKNAVDKLVED